MATISWKNPTSAQFNQATNWSSGTVPGSGDDAVIAVVGNYSINVTASFSVRSLSISNTGTQFYNSATVTEQIANNFTNAGFVQVDNAIGNQGGSNVTVGGTLRNGGTFNIGTTSLNANTTVTASVLANSGTLNLAGSFPGSFQATLAIAGAAGFGSAGLLTGTVNLTGNAAIQFGSGQLTKIAAGAQLDLRGQARIAIGNAATSTALTQLTTNAGTFLLGDGATVATTTAATFANTGTIDVDNQYSSQGGSTLKLGGALANGGTLNIGPSNSTLSANTLVQAAALTNTGTINLYGTFPGSIQAKLLITGAAGFGTAGVLTGAVNLSGNALLQFGSGQITSIAGGATLNLRGQARLANSNSPTSTALTQLVSNAGTLLLGDGDTLTTTTTAAFTNAGTIQVDNQYSGQGGSKLTFGGALVNNGTLNIGPGNASLGSTDFVKAASLTNTGTINITGLFPGSAQAQLIVGGAAGFGTAGVLTGTVNLAGNATVRFGTGQITSIAKGASLDLRGQAVVANASDATTSSALTKLTSNAGTLLIGDGDTVTTTTAAAFTNNGALLVDNQYSSQGGSTLTLGGALINNGTLSIGPGNNSLSSNDLVQAKTLTNTGSINIAGNFSGSNQAKLLITGAAGFGTAGVLTGAVTLYGNALLQFGSGQITSIAGGASLNLRGQARLANSNATTSTALTALTDVSGTLLIGDGDTVTTTTTADLTNAGTIQVDSQYSSQGGSTLTLGGALINNGALYIGPTNNSVSSNTLVQATALTNTGSIVISGNFPGTIQAKLFITGAAGFGTAGVLTGAVSLSGNALLEFGTGQITGIAGGASLNLRGQAVLANASGTTTSSALTGLTSNAGTFLLGDTESVTTTGTGAFTNTGTILIDNQYSGQGGSTLTLGGALNNSGTVNLGPGNNSLSGNDALRAKGLNNTGTINLNGNLGEGSIATLGITGAATNAGAINVASAGVLAVTAGTYVQSTGGVTTLQGGGALTATTSVTGGTLNGNGTVNGATSLTGGDTTGGFLNGSTPGTLTVNGNLAVSSAAVVHELLRGTGSGQASKIAVTGDVDLSGGTLEVDVNGFSLAAGETFTVMTFTPGDLTGTFATLVDGQVASDGSSLDLGNGLTIGLIYNNAAGTVQLGVAATAATTADNWLGGVGNFATATDWDNGVPTFFSDVTIGNPAASGNVTLSADATISTLKLLQNNALTDSVGANLATGGKVTLSSGSAFNVLGTVSIGGVLSDAGKIVIGNGSASSQLTVDGAMNGNGSLLINAHGLLLTEGGGSQVAKITNNGSIEANGPLLNLKNDIAGTGTLLIDTASSLELGGATANTVVFNGSAATLKLDAPTSFSGTLSSLDGGDVLDLGATNATGVTLSGSTLHVALQGGGTDSFALSAFAGTGFTLTHNGTDSLITVTG